MGFRGSLFPRRGIPCWHSRRGAALSCLRREGCEPKGMGREGQGCTRGFLSCPAAVPRVTCCPLAPEQKGWSGGRETSPEIFEKFNLGRTPPVERSRECQAGRDHCFPRGVSVRSPVGPVTQLHLPPSLPKPPAKDSDGKCSLTAFPGLSEALPPALPVAASSFARSGLKKAALCR